HIQAGGVDSTSVISAMDLYPSLCRMAGIRLEKGYKSDGEDRSQTLLGKRKARKGDLMWDFGRNKFFNRPGKAINRSPHLAIRHGKWKLICNDGGADAELYDLSVDGKEQHNVAAENPKITRQLVQKVCRWYEKRPRLGGQ
ncbi:MAG: N-acetylgalactosamine-6-sulfatase, partial [Bacteroidaceae bacterium]|nr:N-acetylgalactosamine-6-sulfatase [Bacteroidaceae bacterium]